MRGRSKALIAVGAFLILVVAYYGVRLFTLQASLRDALTQVQLAQAAGEKQDFKGVANYLGVVAKDANMANSVAKDVLLSPLSIVPGIGETWVAIGKITEATSGIANYSEPAFRYAVALQSDLVETGLVDGKSASAFADAFEPLSASVISASESLSTIDASKLAFGLEDQVAKLQQLVSTTATITANAESYVKAFSAVVATPGVSNWVIATQNLAESRGTGGLFGAYAVIRNEDGKLSLIDSGSDAKAMAKGAVANESLSEELVSFYGIDQDDWRDFNISAHVPLSGQIMADTFKKNFGLEVSGVLFIGQGGLRHISAAAGPVNIRGKEISAENVSDYMAKTIYADFVNVDKKNDFVQKLMKALFGKVVAGSFELRPLIESFTVEPTGDRVFVWSADPDAQAKNERMGISGSVSSTPGSNVWVTVNNAGGNKIDAYLTMSLEYSQGTCGVVSKSGYLGRESSVVIRLKNNAPRKGLPKYVTPRLDIPAGLPWVKGSNRDLIAVYAPVGATDNGFTRDGKVLGASFSSEKEHPVWLFDINLNPGQSTELVVNFVEPITNTDGRLLQSVPKLVPPVMFNPVEVAVNSPGFCSLPE